MTNEHWYSMQHSCYTVYVSYNVIYNVIYDVSYDVIYDVIYVIHVAKLNVCIKGYLWISHNNT